MKKFYIIILTAFVCGISNAQNTWTQKTNFLGSARWGAVAFSIGTKAYLGTGNDGSNKKDFWEWDQANNSWSQKADFPGTARYQAVGFSIGSKGYIGTGAAGLGFPYTPHFSDFWEYDTSSGAWTNKAPFPGTARFGAVGFSIGDKGYIGTGFDAFSYFLSDFWEYDQANDHWYPKAALPGIARMEAVGFSIGSKGYIGTGGNYMSGNILLKDFWQYNPDSDQWAQKANFGGIGRSQGVGFSAGGKGYIGIGGDFSSVSYPDFWEYDTSGNQWTQRANFGGAARWLSTGFGIGNKGYIGTGGNFAPTYKDLWEYNPTSTAINESNNQTNISIFPNPADQFIKLTLDISISTNCTIVFLNSAGQKIKSKSVKQGINIINVSELNPGIYFYQVVDEQKIICGNKFIIVR